MIKKTIGLLGLVTSVLLLGSFSVVSTGNVGVKVQFGKVYDQALFSGLHFKIPLIQSIDEVNVRTQTFSEETITYTKDIQTSKIRYTVYFNLDPKKATEMYRDFGKEWEDKFVPQAVQGELKNIIGKWDAVDLISHREMATLQILEALRKDMAQKNIQVTRLEITNIDYNDDFEKAVEAKVIAIQDAAKAQNHTQQIQEEAKQKIISAKAEAESMKIRSEALSQNQNLVAYEAVHKWDGKMPQYMMGNTVPFINLNK